MLEAALDVSRHIEWPAGDLAALDHVSKSFGSTRAVNDVSLRFRSGEVHCVLGENGAGKSTVGKMLSGLVQPDTGRILLDGTVTRLRSVADARAHRIAMVFQELSLVPDLTVAENICLGTERAGNPFNLLRRGEENARCRALFAEYAFEFDLATPVRQLSVANQQLVEVVKALARQPRLLILDEPTAMLGIREKHRLLDVIRAARRRSVAIVFVTHHVEEVVEVADRVSLMKDGSLVDSFRMTEAVDAGFIVAKLAGQSRPGAARAARHPDRREIFSVRSLPGAGDAPVTIAVDAGQVVGLYGVVGSGCEAVGRAAVGLADIRPATMTLAGQPHRPATPARAARLGVSYLPSGRAANCILPTRSTRENLMISQLAKTQHFGVIDDRAEQTTTRAVLARFRTRYADYDAAITHLSGGNQQKVMLARCLGRESRLVVLEDPTAGVDVGSKRDIHELIRERLASGLAVLLISSDLAETISLSDVIYTVHDGRIVRRYADPTPADEANILADVLGK
jgi:ribose transport system ATP-binding protein